ncbi:MAG: diacylglycerol kinase family lipid kinase [Blastocatellia bacterium]|nr:diacylglycerol kinase family lipid kinase [Blastocatellia bacterium]
MNTLTILNPTAGHGKTRKYLSVLPDLLTRNGLSNRIELSRSSEHIRQMAEEGARAGLDMVIVCGGDGTIHHAINGLRGSRTALGILPLGTGNDFARTLGIPWEVEQTCAMLGRGRIQEIDLADTGGCVYACIGSVGFDTAVLKRANQRKFWLRGPLIYTYAIFGTLLTYQPKRLKLTHDGGVFEDEVMFAVVGNTMQYGGGMRIVPGADPSDGLLDVCIVRRMSNWDLIKTFPQVFRGGHVSNPNVVMFRSQKVELDSDEPMELFGDGEYLENTPSEIRALRGALRVVIP